LRGYPPCIFREVIAMKKNQISGVEMDRLKILSDVLNGKLTPYRVVPIESEGPQG
jgi:hypothetical protein